MHLLGRPVLLVPGLQVCLRMGRNAGLGAGQRSAVGMVAKHHVSQPQGCRLHRVVIHGGQLFQGQAFFLFDFRLGKRRVTDGLAHQVEALIEAVGQCGKEKPAVVAIRLGAERGALSFQNFVQ